MRNKTEILIPDATYHVYSRANGSETLFIDSGNYHFFLEHNENYISPIADTFCYCSMPNHFHFLIRIKSEKDLEYFYNQQDPAPSATLQGFKTLKGLPDKASYRNF